MTPLAQGFGIFTTDTRLVVQTWDAWLAQATGRDAADAQGRPLGELVPDLKWQGLRAHFERVITDGVVELLAPALHSHLFPCPPQRPSRHFNLMQQRVTIAPLREEEQIVGALVTVEDVTPRRERERELAALLDSPDEATRLQAAQALAAEQEAAPALADALGNASWRVRKTAVAGIVEHGDATLIEAIAHTLQTEHRNPGTLNSALQVLGLTDTDATGLLLGLLGSEDSDLRIYVALALGERGDRAAAPALAALLDDPDPNVRYHAIEALGKLRASEASPQLVTIAASGDGFLAFAALDALALIGDELPALEILPLLDDPFLAEPAVDLLGRTGDLAAVAPLAQALTVEQIPVEATARALATLFAQEEQTYGEGALVADEARRAVSPAGIRRLIAALEAGREADAPALARVLSWLNGPEVTHALMGQLGRPELANVVVESFVRDGSSAVEQLLALLDADSEATVTAAVTALGRIGATRAVPALTRLLAREGETPIAAAGALAQIGDQGPFEALLGMLSRPEAAVRQAAVGALNAIGHPQMAARIATMVDAPNPHVREAAVQIIGYFGYPSGAPALIARCHDPDERVRRAAVAQLPFADDPRALQALIEALRDGTPLVRAAAARALAHVETAAAVEPLLIALDDAEPWPRYYAAQSLGRLEAGAAAGALLRLASDDPAPQVRLAALEALALVGGQDEARAIAPLAANRDTELACAAIKTLGALGGPAAAPALGLALAAREPARRIAALEALARSGTGDVVLLRRVAATDRAPAVRVAAVAALGTLPTDEAAAALVELTADPALRPTSVAALAGAGARWLGAIADGLTHESARVRRAMVEALARLRRPAAARYLRAATEDADPAVQAAAAAALQRLGGR